MSLSCLPKELRLYIWQLAYYSQPPRLVELRTASHNTTHDETMFCPRYSPSPAPIVVDVCREARVEARYQARRTGHVVRLEYETHLFSLNAPTCFTAEFYFRFETDILYVPLEDSHVEHFDDSPENGLLPHFRQAVDCEPSSLRNIAITQVIKAGFEDGSISNCLRDFPNLSCIYMILPDEVLESQAQRSSFVRAARRIMTLYRFDKRNQLGKFVFVETEFARLVNGHLEVVPKATWKTWSDLGLDWVRQRDWSLETMTEDTFPLLYN